MLKFVPDHLNTKRMCKNTVEKFSFVIRYVPYRYKTQEMCDIVVLENGGMLKFVTDYCKNQKCVIKLFIIMLMH